MARRLWRLAAEEKPKPNPLCTHLGQLLDTVPYAGCCGGRVSVKVYECAIHGKATVGLVIQGVATCECSSYTPKPQ